uniref:C2H2-type domain-containing protein n=1 Tax=Oreochromis niloticus TaxID=8128 RepID=A0A669F0N5_ORENI
MIIFASRTGLVDHQKTHTGQNLYSCSICEKVFSTAAATLRVHRKTHMADKPHACSICPRSFLKPCLLRQHMRTHIRDGLIANPADKVTPRVQTSFI